VVKIRSIETVRVHSEKTVPKSKPRRQPWSEHAEVANPMSRYTDVKRRRSMWRPGWSSLFVKVTADDGTWGLGPLTHAEPTRPVVEHLAPHLTGQDCMATEKLADRMFRLTKPYGTQGLASFAISALDLAFWDLKGKLLDQPVYALLGGPARDRLLCYATGNDIDWYLELGFRAFKLACPYGPADGLDGLRRNEELVAKARETVGDHCELMLDCWMAFDVEYAVRLAETLRPYGLRWLEECLIPEDLDAHRILRKRLPWQALATGEHWYTHVPFQWAARHKVVDILQPDIAWCGGLSTCRSVASIADAAGLAVILHGGGNTPFGQHFSYASPAVPMLECFISTAPGVPLEEGWGPLGQAVPKDGWLVPKDAPGFGLEVLEEQLVPV
jgi:L-rhamnonate dehydratase